MQPVPCSEEVLNKFIIACYSTRRRTQRSVPAAGMLMVAPMQSKRLDCEYTSQQLNLKFVNKYTCAVSTVQQCAVLLEKIINAGKPTRP